jgi:acetyl esterase/lipase
VIRLGNVTHPTLSVYRPKHPNRSAAAVIVCPGGGHHILAWDLEGTEVAEWLNELGITAVVLKYRVPATVRDPDRRWHAAVQDAQRAVSLVRANAERWDLNPHRIGMLGFSAGGQTAALTSILAERKYEAVDAHDEQPSRPNFTVLIYPAGLVTDDNAALRHFVRVDEQVPPMFFAHAYDDRARVENSVLLFLELKKREIPSELHVFATGGHGFGLRPTAEPVTRWPEHCEKWLYTMNFLESRQATP